jgi:H2-forming N5,N10-methylenetetrahydromethanopterin dehydrogenase-like enzyme
MLIIVDKTTKKKIKDYGTNSLFPMGIPYTPNENELVFRLHDTENPLVKKCFETGLYEVV